MKAVRFREYGGPEVLRVVDVEEPHAGPGQVRIAVRAAGVNPSDWKDRSGDARDSEPVALPSGVGFEASGVVDEVGPGVFDVAVGDAVFGYGVSTVAQYAVLTHWAHKPEGVPFEVPGGLPVITETASRCLDQLGVCAGETLLVSGAAGGIGSATVQLARLRGVTIIGTARPEKHDYLRDLGAIPTTYGPGLMQRVKALAPAGVSAALDVAGSGIIPELMEIVAIRARRFRRQSDGAEVRREISSWAAEERGAGFAEVARLVPRVVSDCTWIGHFPSSERGRRRKSAPREA